MSADSKAQLLLPISSTGTTMIALGDTVQFNVTVELNEGQTYSAVLWHLSGGIGNAVGSSEASGWAGVSNWVNAWEWRHTPPGSASVDIGLTDGIIPALPTLPPTLPDRVVGPFGFSGPAMIGSGVPVLIGTVTLEADALRAFLGGAYLQPGLDVFGNNTSVEEVAVGFGSFTVVPEPGTALLLILGLICFGAMSRRVRN